MAEEAASRTILIADDDPDTRMIVSGAITALDYKVVEAVDGTSAIKQCEEALPDLAILDVMMPGCYGTEVCKQLKKMEGGEYVPVLILTARDSIKDKVVALEGGADDYLTKPFHFQELQARVKALLRVRDLNLRLREKNLELVEMQEKLVQQERQLLVAQLAGTAAHALGQPLSAIMLNCHLLEALPPTDPRYTKAIEAIKQDSKRMAELLEKLREADAKKTEKYYQGTAILDIDKK